MNKFLFFSFIFLATSLNFCSFENKFTVTNTKDFPTKITSLNIVSTYWKQVPLTIKYFSSNRYVDPSTVREMLDQKSKIYCAFSEVTSILVVMNTDNSAAVLVRGSAADRGSIFQIQL